jgi:hypothetical protein
MLTLAQCTRLLGILCDAVVVAAAVAVVVVAVEDFDFVKRGGKCLVSFYL